MYSLCSPFLAFLGRDRLRGPYVFRRWPMSLDTQYSI